jgi:hypothetical protein
VKSNTRIKHKGSDWRLTTKLQNVSRVPALMVRVKAVGNVTRDLIVPALFSDNYIALMPGEERTLTISLRDEDTRGEKPEIEVRGFNLAHPNSMNR